MNDVSKKRNQDRTIRQEVLDRLVDGELSEVDRRDLLRQLESQPSAWRQCALAFLESQMWSQDLSGGARQTSDPTTKSMTGQRRLPESPDRANLGRWKFGWLAIAAAVVAAFGLGRQLDRVGRTDVTSTASQIVEASPSAAATAMAAPQEWLAAQTLPQDVERMLRDLGVEVEQSQGWMVRQTDDGYPAVVPYQDVQIVPVRGPAY